MSNQGNIQDWSSSSSSPASSSSSSFNPREASERVILGTPRGSESADSRTSHESIPQRSTNSSSASTSTSTNSSKEKFMKKALQAAKKSKDPNTKVGAVIVNRNNKKVGVGYNTMPNGCLDEGLWDEDKKKWYVCHAELNAVMNRTSADVKDCTMYVTLFPCNECAKLIIQSGIKHIVYNSSIKCLKRKQARYVEKASDPFYWKNKFSISDKMLKAAGIRCEKYLVEESGSL